MVFDRGHRRWSAGDFTQAVAICASENQEGLERHDRTESGKLCASKGDAHGARDAAAERLAVRRGDHGRARGGRPERSEEAGKDDEDDHHAEGGNNNQSEPTAATAKSVVPSTVAPGGPPNYLKILAAAASTEADLGPNYRFGGDPTNPQNDAAYKSVTEGVAACNGFPDVIPNLGGKSKAVQGWLYTNSTTGKAVPHVVVITADDATAHGVLESIRTFASFPACTAGFNDAQSLRTAVRDNPSLTGKDARYVSTRARFGPPLSGLGDDQVTVQFEQTLFVDGVAQPAIAFTKYIAKIGPAILEYQDEPSAAAVNAPKLADKLRAALKA